VAQDLGLESRLHEAGQCPFEHDQEGQAEEGDGHVVAGGEVAAVEHEVFGDEKAGQHDEEKGVVAVAVGSAMADQRPQQHVHDAAEKEVVGEQKEGMWPIAAKGHADPLDHPGGAEQHEGRTVVATDIDPVLGRGEEEATEHRPAEAEEHFVGVPLDGCKARYRARHGAAEDERPEQWQKHPGQAGQAEEWPKADEPERVSRKRHVNLSFGNRSK
jgi:hypothetical protein